MSSQAGQKLSACFPGLKERAIRAMRTRRCVLPALVVVFAGRFQPFHSGHHGVYTSLCARFGPDAVYLASAERRAESGRPAPFSFEERHRQITGLFDVPSDRVVRVKSPYGPTEILSGHDPEQTSFVAVVGARDEGRLTSRYWRPFTEDGPREPYPRCGYILTAPPAADDLSATEIRAVLGDPALPRHNKEARFRAWYPRWDEALFEQMVERLQRAREA